MARPRKNNADYFPHDTGMRNNAKIQAVRSKYRDGYAIYCMFLEVLADADNFRFPADNDIKIELLAGDFRVATDELKAILEYFVLVDLIQLKQGFYSCGQLVDRLGPMLSKRDNMRHKFTETRVSDTETGVNEETNPQSKVKESKVSELYKYNNDVDNRPRNDNGPVAIGTIINSKS